MRKSKADGTQEEIFIILSDISKATTFLHQAVASYGFLKLVRYNCNLNKTNLRLSQFNTVSLHHKYTMQVDNAFHSCPVKSA